MKHEEIRLPAPSDRQHYDSAAACDYGRYYLLPTLACRTLVDNLQLYANYERGCTAAGSCRYRRTINRLVSTHRSIRRKTSLRLVLDLWRVTCIQPRHLQLGCVRNLFICRGRNLSQLRCSLPAQYAIACTLCETVKCRT
jgi:hypothetical protein